MNFIFIIDSSISMSQTFDGMNYFDSAKSAIQMFFERREQLNIKRTNKTDKYFLLTLNDDLYLTQNMYKQWEYPPHHFFYQLKSLKLSYDFKNIEQAITKGFNLANYIRKIGLDKHIFGRKLMDIQNTFLILFTNGGKLCSNKSIYDKTNSNTSLLNVSNQKDNNNIPMLYNELYRWDQSFYAIIMCDEDESKENIPSYSLLKQYTKNVKGKVFTASNFFNLSRIIYNLTDNVFKTPRIYTKLSSIVLGLNDLKEFILQIDLNNNVIYKNIWPFPEDDDLQVQTDMKTLPIKKAHPCYYISSSAKIGFEVNQRFYDEFDINDKKFLRIILSSHFIQNLKVKEFLNFNKNNIYFDITIKPKVTANENDQKNFAVIVLYFERELIEEMSLKLNNKITLYEFLANDNNYNNKLNLIKVKFHLLPFNYEEFIKIVERYETNVTTKPELKLEFKKYIKDIPFYYKIDASNFLLRITSDKYFDNMLKEIEKEHLNEYIQNEIKRLFKIETELAKGINRSLKKNQSLHQMRSAGCCQKQNYNSTKNFHFFKPPLLSFLFFPYVLHQIAALHLQLTAPNL